MFDLVIALRRLGGEACGGGSSAATQVRAGLIERVEGTTGLGEDLALRAATQDLSLGAAAVLAHLDRPSAAFALLAHLNPGFYPEVVSVGRDILPVTAPDTLFAHRRWVSQFLTAYLRSNLADTFAEFVRDLHLRGHFELVEILRSSAAARFLRPADLALIDASSACWSARYEEVARHLEAVELEGADRAEADLLRAIAGGASASSPPAAVLTALERLASEPGLDQRIGKVADRWRADWQSSRAGTPAAEVFRGGTEHPAVRLVHWNSYERRTSDLWIFDQLRAQGIAGVDALLDLYNRSDPLEARTQLRELFGGNRNDTCTIVERLRLRVVTCRTARQQAVEVQARLIDDGPEVVLAEFRQLAGRYADAAPFRTYAAEVLLWLGRYEEAAALFEAVGRTDPEGWSQRWVPIGLGAALAAMGRDREADEVWRKGARLNGILPGEASLVYRAEVCARRGDLSAGDALLRQVLAEKPTRTRAWIQQAEVAWLLNRPDDARSALDRAATLCPGIFTTVLGTGATIEPDLGRDDSIDACRQLRQAMLGNVSSWMFTWRDRADTWRAFRFIAPDRLTRALDRLGRIDDSDPAAGGRRGAART